MSRAYNYAFSLSALSWAALRIFKIPDDERFTIVNFSIIVLHLQIAILFWIRSPIDKSVSWRGLVIAFWSLITGGLLLRFAPPLHLWSLTASLVFLFSTIWVLISFLFLGKSFAILPVAREVVGRGPYALIRHPAYLGEFSMLTIAAIASGDWRMGPLLLVALAAIAFRILEEEAVLNRDLDYNIYCEKVRFRFIPLIW